MNKYQKYPIGDKSTWGQSAKDIVSGNLNIPLEETPELLGWLQDINWPGAVLISDYLSKVSPDQLVNPINEILNEKDYIWSFWILTELVSKWDKTSVEPLKVVMEKLLSNADFLKEDDDGALLKIYNKNFN